MQIPNGLPQLFLGSHVEGMGALCAMEAAAWLAGEPHTDHPKNVDETLAFYGRLLNDDLKSADERGEMWPLIFRCLNTRLGNDMELAFASAVGNQECSSYSCTVEGFTKLIDFYDTFTGRNISTVPRVERLADVKSKPALFKWTGKPLDSGLHIAGA